MPVSLQNLIGIVALGSLQIREDANLLFFPIFLKQFAPGPIAMPMMILQALKLAGLLAMSLHFVLLIDGLMYGF